MSSAVGDKLIANLSWTIIARKLSCVITRRQFCVDIKFSFELITFLVFVSGWMIIMITYVFYIFLFNLWSNELIFKECILTFGLICLCHLRMDKRQVHAAYKPFEGISKAVCERISHSRPDNVNSYRTDEDFLWTDMAQPFERLTIFC